MCWILNKLPDIYGYKPGSIVFLQLDIIKLTRAIARALVATLAKGRKKQKNIHSRQRKSFQLCYAAHIGLLFKPKELGLKPYARGSPLGITQRFSHRTIQHIVDTINYVRWIFEGRWGVELKGRALSHSLLITGFRQSLWKYTISHRAYNKQQLLYTPSNIYNTYRFPPQSRPIPGTLALLTGQACKPLQIHSDPLTHGWGLEITRSIN